MTLREWLMAERQAERFATLERGRRETFPTTGAGSQALPAAPSERRRQSNVPPPGAEPSPYGRTITVVTQEQPLSGGGTPIEWEQRAPGMKGAGFRETFFPFTRFVPPILAYYTVTIEWRWDVWEDGGYVAVERSGVELYRYQIDDGTRIGPVTIHCGVLEPEDDWIEVIGSPLGDPSLDPFDDAPNDKKALDLRCTFELVERPVSIQTDSGPPAPWAWFEPSSLDGVTDGDAVTYYEDLSGNNRNMVENPDGESRVKVRTVNGEKLLYNDDNIDGQENLISSRWDGGGHIDINESTVGTSFSPDLDEFTLYCEIVDPTDNEVWIQFLPFNEGMRLNQNIFDGDHYSEGEAFYDDLGWPPNGAESKAGKTVVVTRYSLALDRAEMLLDGTVVSTVESLQAAGGTWGFSSGGLMSSSGGLGRMIMWDAWVDDAGIAAVVPD